MFLKRQENSCVSVCDAEREKEREKVNISNVFVCMLWLVIIDAIALILSLINSAALHF